jgi:hypothetical protein
MQNRAVPGGILEDPTNFAYLFGIELAERIVLYGQDGVCKSSQFANLLAEWTVSPPYETFWAEVQVAYRWFLESGPYHRVQKAQRLRSEFDSMVKGSTSRGTGKKEREQATNGDSVLTACTITTEQGTMMNHSDTSLLSGDEFVNLFSRGPYESTVVSAASSADENPRRWERMWRKLKPK